MRGSDKTNDKQLLKKDREELKTLKNIMGLLPFSGIAVFYQKQIDLFKFEIVLDSPLFTVIYQGRLHKNDRITIKYDMKRRSQDPCLWSKTCKHTMGKLRFSVLKR